MEHHLGKKIDATAKYFIVSAYQVGISVVLINKFLRESDWDCTVAAIHDTLSDHDIEPTNYNCSFGSLIWRRYLTNILETSGVSTYEQFEEIALDEGRDYYDINLTTLMEYWDDFNKFTAELNFPPDPAWIMQAFHYFGFTFTGLIKKLKKESISITPEHLYDRYNLLIEGRRLTGDETKLKPKLQPSLAIKHFWRSSLQIGKDVDTIIHWTEIFTGTDATEDSINFTLTQMP